MTQSTRRTVLAVAFTLLASVFAIACGVEITFRAYLDTLWRPTLRSVWSFGKGLPKEKQNYRPYAGMSSGGGSLQLERIRDAYRGMSSDQDFSGSVPEDTLAKIRGMLGSFTPSSDAERGEAGLIRCKVQILNADFHDRGLPAIQACFADYLKQRHPAEWTSEARGWLARTYHLQGKNAEAGRIYLDELASTSSNIRRDRLLTSLQMLYDSTADDYQRKLKADLEGYLDKPSHALFIADRITSSGFREISRKEPITIYNDLIQALETHRNLFGQGSQSDALALELMRASTRAGSPESVLRYAAMIPSNSATRQNAEYDWLVGTAQFQQKNYAESETSLKRVMDSGTADFRQKIFAANGLIGVYARTHQLVEELFSAVSAGVLLPDRYLEGDFDALMDLDGAGLEGDNLDLAYLLDVQMSDSELEEYLKLHPDTSEPKFYTRYSRRRSGSELVKYELAVRHSRREEYAEANSLYRELQAFPRAKRIEAAEKLFDATQQPSSADEHLKALYEYAGFLSQNSTRIFYNDSIWHGFQTWAFVPPSAPGSHEFYFKSAALTSGEVAEYAKLERKVRDDQEEYWKAFQIFDQIVEQSGHTQLGRKAATKAIGCLRQISTARFGHAKEIAAADIRLSNW